MREVPLALISLLQRELAVNEHKTPDGHVVETSPNCVVKIRLRCKKMIQRAFTETLKYKVLTYEIQSFFQSHSP